MLLWCDSCRSKKAVNSGVLYWEIFQDLPWSLGAQIPLESKGTPDSFILKNFQALNWHCRDRQSALNPSKWEPEVARLLTKCFLWCLVEFKAPGLSTPVWILHKRALRGRNSDTSTTCSKRSQPSLPSKIYRKVFLSYPLTCVCVMSRPGLRKSSSCKLQ